MKTVGEAARLTLLFASILPVESSIFPRWTLLVAQRHCGSYLQLINTKNSHLHTSDLGLRPKTIRRGGWMGKEIRLEDKGWVLG